MNYDDAIELLENSGEFLVIKRLKEVSEFNPGVCPVGKLRSVCVLDVETTGLDYKKDEIIEFAYSILEFDEDGNFFNILKKEDLLNEPKNPISTHITELTGLTDDDVRGQVINWDSVANDLQEFNVDIIVAHNSGFDRKFVEAKHDVFKQIPWGCSFTQIDWRALTGVSVFKQDYLAWKVGKFEYNAHRAIDDVNALCYLLNLEVKGKGTFFKNLLLTFNKKKYLIKAVNAAFAFKDDLKKNGYFWNAEEKVWQKFVTEPADKDEIIWLKGIGVNKPDIKEISNLDMFSNRIK